MDEERVPVGELPEKIARLQTLMVEFCWSAGPWIQGVLPAPTTQLVHMVSRLQAMDQARLDLIAECRAVHFEITAARERRGERGEAA
jgi:hypothetical protein